MHECPPAWLTGVFLETRELSRIRLWINTHAHNTMINSLFVWMGFAPITKKDHQNGEDKGCEEVRLQPHFVEQSVCSQFLTSSVKIPITGLWSLMPYSIRLVYRSCLIFSGYSSSSSLWTAAFSSTSELFSSFSPGGGALGRIRHRILSVQAGFRFLPLTGGTHNGQTETGHAYAG